VGLKVGVENQKTRRENMVYREKTNHINKRKGGNPTLEKMATNKRKMKGRVNYSYGEKNQEEVGSCVFIAVKEKGG